MDLTLHPAAAQAIDDKGFGLLAAVDRLEFPAEPRKPAFQTDHVVAAAITDEDVIGEPHAWLQDVRGQRVLAFIRRNEVMYGLTAQSYALVGSLIEEVLKVRWVQRFLSKAFIEDTTLEWCRASLNIDAPTCLSAFLMSRSERSIKRSTLWAPVAHLDVEASFCVGPARISPMTAAMFDGLENPSVENRPQQAQDIRILFSRLRKRMQGGAAVVLEIEAELDYVYERGLTLASDVVGLLRFLSPASINSQLISPNVLLGAQPIPQFDAIVLGENGEFSARSGVIPTQIAYWRLSASEVAAMQNRGLVQLGHLVSEDGLTQFQQRLRACLLAYTKGTTFLEVSDRLVYTCSSLESLLLKSTSEPIQQNLGERIAFLLTKDAARRVEIVGNVRSVYGMRSQYIHHRISRIEGDALATFIMNAHAALYTALMKMDRFKTPEAFIDAIDRVKFGG